MNEALRDTLQDCIFFLSRGDNAGLQDSIRLAFRATTDANIPPDAQRDVKRLLLKLGRCSIENPAPELIQQLQAWQDELLLMEIEPPKSNGDTGAITLAQAARLSNIAKSTLAKRRKTPRPKPIKEKRGSKSAEFDYQQLREWVNAEWGAEANELPASYSEAIAALSKMST